MTTKIVENYPQMVDFKTGTTMVDLDSVKIKLSHRDLLLLIGILVAVIIAVTALVFQESTTYSKETPPPQKSSLNLAPSVMAKKLFEKVTL